MRKIIFIFTLIILCIESSAQDYEWAKKLGGSSVDHGQSIIVDQPGNVYTCGYFSGTSDFDPGTGIFNLISAGINDVYISKLNVSGNFCWAVRMGGTNLDYGTSVAVDKSGNVYSTGYFYGTGDFDPGPDTFNLTSVGGYDIFISKLDSSGNFLWAVNIGESLPAYGMSLTIDSSGNSYTTGFFQGTADFDPGAGTYNLTSDSLDVFVLKLDTYGNFLWAKRLGGSMRDYGNSLAVDVSGNVYTTGYFEGTADFDPDTLTSYYLTASAYSDIFISKLDSSGNFLWAKKVGGLSGDYGESIAVDLSGNVYSTGCFGQTVDFNPGPGSYSLTSAGNEDIYVLKLDTYGNFLWAKRMGGTSGERGYSLALDCSDNVYTTGYFAQTSDFDPGTGTFNITSSGSWDIFISKLNASGNFVWALSMGSATNDIGNSLALDPSGNIFNMGVFTGTVDFDPGAGVSNLTSSGQYDTYVLKLKPLLALSSQPVDRQNVCSGSIVQFGITGTGVSDYQWQRSTDSGNIFTDIAEGAPYTGTKTNTLNITAGSTMNGYLFRCVVTDGCNTLKSDSAILTTLFTPNPAISADGPTSFCSGGSVNLICASGGNALAFDGNLRYVAIPNYSGLNVSQLTVEAWVYPTDINSNRNVFFKGNHQYLLQIRNGKVLYGSKDAGGGYSEFTGSLDVPVNQWSHIAITHDGSVRKIFVNGNPDTVTTAQSGLYTGEPGGAVIGTHYMMMAENFVGLIDEVRVWDTAKAQVDILASMNSEVAYNSAGLTAYFRLNEGAGASSVNSAAPANSGILINTPAWVVPSTAPIYYNYLWSTGATTQSIHITAGGTYMLTVTSTDGCAAVSSKSVTVSLPVPQTIYGTNPLCTGNSAVWSATSGGGSWTSSNPGVASINVSTGLLTGVSQGTSLITYSVTTGGVCVNTATRTVTVNIPTSQTITGQTPLCIGSTAPWASTSSGGTWYSGIPGVAAVNAGTGLVTGVSAGTSRITYSVTIGGCSNTATKTVTIMAPVAQAITGVTPLCAGLTDIWSATTAGGIWASGNPGVAAIDTGTGQVTGVSAGTSLIAYAVTTTGGCVNTATQTITITAPVIQTITGDTILCSGSTDLWTSTTSSGAWTSTVPGIATIDPTTGLVTGVSAGTSLIAYAVTTAGGCVNTATKSVTVINNAAAGITGGTSPVCYGSSPGVFTATLTGGTGIYSYQWYTTPSSIINNATDSTYDPGNMISGAEFYCVVTGSCGTIYSDTINVSVYSDLIASTSGGTSPICDKSSPGTFTAAASGGSGVYAYQWHRTSSGLINGATNSTYNPGIMSTSNGFYCSVTSNPCGSINTSVFNVTVIPWVTTPTPITVSSGTEPVCPPDNDTTTTVYQTTAMNNSGFHWSISNPAAGSIDSLTGEMTWAIGFYGTVDIRVFAYGCGGPSPQVIRTVTISNCGGGYTISGKTRYLGKANNGSPAPNPPTYNSVIYNIDNVIVTLKNYPSGTVIACDTSDALGDYQFTNVVDGAYILSYDKYTVDSMQWGNAVDAIDVSIMKYYIGSDTTMDPSRNFYPKYRKAANADNNLAINAIDISRIKAKIGSPYSVQKNFPGGNWVALDTSVTVAGGNLNIALKTICYGDYNASSSKYRDSLINWGMAKSLPENIIAVSDEYVTTGNPDYFEIPLRISTKMNDFSALGLELNYPDETFSLVSASMSKESNKNGFVKINQTLEEIIAEDNDLLVTDEDGVIRVVFATTDHFDVAANDEIIRLGFRSYKSTTQGALDFELSGTGVMGDQYGQENEDAYLLMPRVFVQGNNTEPGFEFTGYPNPFDGDAILTYSIPADGMVKMDVYNVIGELVQEIINETRNGGRHEVVFLPGSLPAGMYTFRLEYTGTDKTQNKTIRLIH